MGVPRDKHCRVCGHDKKGKRMTQVNRGILSWHQPAQNFGSSTLSICYTCNNNVMRHQHNFRSRKPGRLPPKELTIALWNNETSLPLLDSEGLPLRTKIDSARYPNGCFRKKNGPSDLNEIEVMNEMKRPVEHLICHVEDFSKYNQQDIESCVPHKTSEKQMKRRKKSLNSVIKKRNNPQRTTKKEKLKMFESNVLKIHHDHIKEIDTDIGRGVASTRHLMKSELICTYHGKGVNKKTADKLEKKYAKQKKGCFMFYFKHNEKPYCIDSTKEDPNYGLGRLINHQKAEANIKPEKIIINDTPYIYFTALKEIAPGTELFYNYNDAKAENEWMNI